MVIRGEQGGGMNKMDEKEWEIQASSFEMNVTGRKGTA